MSHDNVENEWSLYQDLWKIMTAMLNGKIKLDSTTVVGPFPKNDKSRWETWTEAVKGLLALDENLEIANAALEQSEELLAAHHRAAAAVSVSVPSDDDVEKLTENLEAVNEEVKKDNRFHAALDIGEALAGAIKQAQAA